MPKRTIAAVQHEMAGLLPANEFARFLPTSLLSEVLTVPLEDRKQCAEKQLAMDALVGAVPFEFAPFGFHHLIEGGEGREVGIRAGGDPPQVNRDRGNRGVTADFAFDGGDQGAGEPTAAHDGAATGTRHDGRRTFDELSGRGRVHGVPPQENSVSTPLVPRGRAGAGGLWGES